MAEYYPRIIDQLLKELLEAAGAVEIVGPKWCGKTTSARRISRSSANLQDKRELRIAEESPEQILMGANPRLIDEWQTVPTLWDAVRGEMDRRNEQGLFLLTGSVQVDRSKIMHSGAGRIISVKMRTMSLYEMKISDGSASLRSMFGQQSLSGRSDLDLNSLAKIIVRGGWPATLSMSETAARNAVKGYCNALLSTEVNLADGKRRDVNRFIRILRSLSRNVGSQIPNTKLLNEICGDRMYTMSSNTFSDYLSALRSISVIEDMPSWNPKLRSSTATRTAPTRYLCDPAICTYFLGASASDLLADFNTFGLLFECLAVRDLRVYAQALGGTVCHYRDSNDLEVDCIVHLDSGDWGAVEIKLTSYGIESAVKALDKLRDSLSDEVLAHMKFRAVLIGECSDAYVRRDGIYIVPISCFGP